MRTAPLQRRGECRRCQRRTAHSHTASGPVWWLHQLSGHLLPRLGLGFWSCDQCYRRRLWLSWTPEPDAGSFEPAGNYLIRDNSLLGRSLRSSRYSRKFRDSVIDRLVAGQTLPENVRSELEVRDSDILAWMADRIQRQHEQIHRLTIWVEQLSASLPQSRLASTAGDPDDEQADNPYDGESETDDAAGENAPTENRAGGPHPGRSRGKVR